MVRGFKNDFGFALQVIEADQLDETLNKNLTNGHRIVMGVELNEWGAAVAYHISTSHPGDNITIFNNRHYKRVPAADVLHLYMAERPGQARGVPWMHTAINRLNQVGAYEEAELIAARISSSKMGFYTSPDGDQYVGDEDDAGNLLMDMEPGAMEQLPQGVGFQAFDPQHPTSAYQAFIKTALRGAASGLNVAYNTLANDLEGVNFSSIRSGVLEEREQWRTIQNWLSNQLCRPVYRAWLVQALTTQALALPQRKYEKFTKVEFQPRGWAWVDPLKDQQASKLGIEMGIMSRTEVAAAAGRDFEDTLAQLQAENELLKQYGIAVEQVEPQEVNNDKQDD
jgi:lambda family phage portal protein